MGSSESNEGDGGGLVPLWPGEGGRSPSAPGYLVTPGTNTAWAYDPVNDVRVTEDGVLAWSSEKPRLHRQVTEYFSNRKEGPKPNKTDGLGGAEVAEGDEPWMAQRKSLSRPVRSFLGYHCGRSDYRASCKIAFRLWGDTLRSTQLQILNKKLREQQAAAAELSEEAFLSGGTWHCLLPEGHAGVLEAKWCRNRFTPYLCIDPVADAKPGARDAEEEIEVLREVPLGRVREMMAAGEMLLPSLQTCVSALAWLAKAGMLPAGEA